MALNLVEVDPPRLPPEGWFTDTASEILSGDDADLFALLKSMV